MNIFKLLCKYGFHDYQDIQPFFIYPEHICSRCGKYVFGENKEDTVTININSQKTS